MKRIFAITLFAVAMLVASIAPSSAAPHLKATGDVNLTGGIGDRHAVFNAHDDAPAAKKTVEDRGDLYFEITSGPNAGSWFTADLNCVEVANLDGYFSGVVTDGSGFYAPFVGGPVFGHVFDGGTPGQNGDTWQATFTPGGPGPCAAPTGGNPVTGGNLVVHS
jgi:hypothetical protein